MSQFGTIPPGYHLVPWCHVYGYEAPPAHRCIEGTCYPATVPITLPRPLLQGDYSRGILINDSVPTPTEPAQDHCDRHGTGWVVECGSNPGFGGETIDWWRMSCGCTAMEQLGDPLDGIR